MIISKHRRTKVIRSHARNRVRKKPPPMQQPDAVVLSYSKLLLGEVKEMENLVNDYLLPKLNFLTAKSDSENIVVRADDIDVTAKIAGLFHSMKMKFFGEAGHSHEPKLINYTRKITNKIVKPMLSRANDHNKRQFSKGMQTVLNVDPLKAEPFLRDQVALATKANVDLIKTIPQDYFKDIEGMVTHAARSGESIDTLAEKIHARTGNEQSRCRLIARDQISKFNGSLHEERAKNNGITRYIWHTVGDVRVRSDHDDLNDNTYLWDKPPVINKRTSERGHPGAGIQCRCYAENVWDDLIDPKDADKEVIRNKPEPVKAKVTHKPEQKLVVKEPVKAQQPKPDPIHIEEIKAEQEWNKKVKEIQEHDFSKPPESADAVFKKRVSGDHFLEYQKENQTGMGFTFQIGETKSRIYRIEGTDKDGNYLAHRYVKGKKEGSPLTIPSNKTEHTVIEKPKGKHKKEPAFAKPPESTDLVFKKTIGIDEFAQYQKENNLGVGHTFQIGTTKSKIYRIEGRDKDGHLIAERYIKGVKTGPPLIVPEG